MKKKMFNVQQHVRFGILTAVLLLSATMILTTTDGSQQSVQAQTSTLLPSELPQQDSTSTPTTPASEPSGGSSSGSDSDSTDESSDSSESAENNDLQDTSSSEGPNSV
ncbi:MAG: hypothetical protein WAM26_11310, partial [Nitrososphaeraceae archaeon]